MSAEDYHDVPGIGGGTWIPRQPKKYTCQFCKEPITFSQRKAFNADGSAHRCKTQHDHGSAKSDEAPQSTLFAMAAMNAIINAQIQVGGIDFIHSMNFYDVADASWNIAAAMVKREETFRTEFGGLR